mgnify:CR=1 FL=1
MTINNTSLTDKFILFLATGFNSGYSPIAPGTMGTIVALVAFLFLQQLPVWLYAVILISASLIGIAICNKADQLLKTHDNKAIVWDEFCGLWLTLFMAPSGWQAMVVGFLLFRLFDIAKPFPISLIDRAVPGGLGVMLDDLVAGAFALVILQSLYHWNILPLSFS